MGVRLMDIADEDEVTSLALLAAEDEEDDETDENAPAEEEFRPADPESESEA